MFYFSRELLVILQKFDETHRSEMVNAIRARLKCPEVYKALTLALGVFGFHRLYLKDVGAMWLRLNYLIAMMIAAVSGIYFSSYPMLGVSLALMCLIVSLWIYDILTPEYAVRRYHQRIEKRVVDWYRVRSGNN